MTSTVASDLLKTLKSSFGIKLATLSAAGLTAARTLTLQDAGGTLAFLENMDRNALINGAMDIAQRGTSFAAIANGAYSLDRWMYVKVGAMVHTASRQQDAPTLAESGMLLSDCLRLALTTADTSIAAGDYCFIQQPVEGYNWRKLAQQACTLSFWVKAGVTGIYCAALRNSGTDRSFIAEYTISAANTWEYKTVAVPGSPSAGTWNYTTSVGIYVSFTLACGSTFQTTAGAWQTGNFLGTSNQVNGVNTGAGNFQLTGVQLEPGVAATPFVVPEFEREVARAMRYYETGVNARVGVPGNGAVRSFRSTVSYNVRKRATPTMTLSSIVEVNCTSTGAGLITSAHFVIEALTDAVSGSVSTTCNWASDAEL